MIAMRNEIRAQSFFLTIKLKCVSSLKYAEIASAKKGTKHKRKCLGLCQVFNLKQNVVPSTQDSSRYDNNSTTWCYFTLKLLQPVLQEFYSTSEVIRSVPIQNILKQYCGMMVESAKYHHSKYGLSIQETFKQQPRADIIKPFRDRNKPC